MRNCIILVVLVLGCNSLLYAQNYFPTQKNSKWKYQLSITGHLNHDSCQQRATNQRRVFHKIKTSKAELSLISDTLFNNKTYHVMKTISSVGVLAKHTPPPETTITFIIVENKFVYLKEALTDPDELSEIIGKTSYVDNEWWLENGDTVRVKHVETVEVNKKTYKNCFKHCYSAGDLKEAIYAPDVGLIQFVLENMTLDLVEYTAGTVNILSKQTPGKTNALFSNRNNSPQLFDVKGRLIHSPSMQKTEEFLKSQKISHGVYLFTGTQEKNIIINSN